MVVTIMRKILETNALDHWVFLKNIFIAVVKWNMSHLGRNLVLHNTLLPMIIIKRKLQNDNIHPCAN